MPRYRRAVVAGGHVLLHGGDLPSPAALQASVGAANARQRDSAWTARDLGLSRQDKEALWLQMIQPAYRRLAELEVSKQGEAVRVRVTHRMKLRLDYASVRPEWNDSSRLALVPRSDDTEKAAERPKWTGTSVEWEAQPGEYLLKSKSVQ